MMLRGFLGILPLAAGVAAYGFAFGVLAGQAGFPWWGVALMSATVNAGTSQIVAVERLVSTGAVIGAALAGIALNLRYLGIIASISDTLEDAPLARKLFAIHITGDENWALTLARRSTDPSIGSAFLIGSGITLIVTWITSTSLGALLGQTVPDFADLGLGFAFTAAFIAMARAMWRGRQNALPWATSFVITIGLVKATDQSSASILAGSICGVFTAMALHKKSRPLPDGD